MNDSQVKQQISQMVSFIKQEADEKANEIRVKAEEDFNIRKLSAVESSREKIREEYERKTKQIQINQKIAYSTANNDSRLKVLKFKEQMMREIYDEAMQKLEEIEMDSERYAELLRGFILQGLIVLGDQEVAVVTKEKDSGFVQQMLPQIADMYEHMTGKKVYLALTSNEVLPEDHAGGITLVSEDGKIRLANTFESRLETTYESNLPYFRSALGFNEQVA